MIFGTRETGVMTMQDFINGHNEQQDYWMLKLSSTGTEIWQKTYGDSRFDVAAQLIAKSNGNFVFVGSSKGVNHDVQGRILEVKGDGTIVRNLSYGGPYSYTMSLTETLDGGVITTGFEDLNGINAKGLEIFKFSSIGILEWRREHQEAGRFLFGRSILPEADGGYRVAVAEGKFVALGNPDHMAVYKTYPLGNYY